MLRQPWQRTLYRRVRHPESHKVGKAVRSRGEGGPILSLLITLVVAGLLFLSFMFLIQRKLHPMVSEIAQAQINNTVNHVLSQGMSDDLSRIRYEELVAIQRDQSGNIIALTTNMGQINSLRSTLVSAASESLEQLQISDIRLPLGSLMGSDFLWAHGPSIRVRAMSIGTVSTAFESEFTSAGVNQTLHRIWLEVTAPTTVLLPGGPVEVPVSSRLCMAETVIVGRVPDSYFQMSENH